MTATARLARTVATAAAAIALTVVPAAAAFTATAAPAPSVSHTAATTLADGTAPAPISNPWE